MIAHDYVNINTSPRPSLCCMAMVGIVRALGFAVFVAAMYAAICVFMSY